MNENLHIRLDLDRLDPVYASFVNSHLDLRVNLPRDEYISQRRPVYIDIVVPPGAELPHLGEEVPQRRQVQSVPATDRKGPLSERTDEEVIEDTVACLRQVDPQWLALFPDDATLYEHVRQTLAELEMTARQYGGAAETACMRVTYTPDLERTEWCVLVGSRFEDNDA